MAMIFAPLLVVIVSIVASTVAQCNAQQRAADAANAAQAQAAAEQARAREQVASPPTPAATTKDSKLVLRAGDRVEIDGKTGVRTAVILAALGTDRYRIHYEGAPRLPDEVVDVSRIRGKR
jgi:hypothetical protein